MILFRLRSSYTIRQDMSIIKTCYIELSIGVFFFVSVVTATPSLSQNSIIQPRFNVVLHDTLVQADIAHLVHTLNENYDRIKNSLGVSSLPQISVQVWSDESMYQQAMMETLGMRFPGSRGYVTGDKELRLLFHRRLSAQKEAIHEFVHVVSLNLNPDFGNNPRWLWEAVALYLAEEFRDPREVDYLLDGSYPTLQELNSGFNSGRNIYDVGFLLGDYIVSTWSINHLIDLIRSNGNIEATLGITENSFEADWHSYIQENYMIP